MSLPMPIGMSAILCAYMDACERHAEFPGDPSAIGSILVEEALEAIQAINDHRDAGGSLDDVMREIAHVGAVCLRALERLTPESD